MHIPKIFPIAFCLILICSCGGNPNGPGANHTPAIFKKDKFDEDDFAQVLRDDWNSRPADSALFSRYRSMAQLYLEKGYEPVWVTKDGGTKMAHQLLNELDSIRWDGINPERYRLSELKSLLAQFETRETSELSAVLDLDTSLTQSYFTASKELLLGTIVPEAADSLWFHVNDSSWNIKQASTGLVKGNYVSLEAFRSKQPPYAILRNALHHYADLVHDSTFNALKAVLPETGDKDSVILSIISTEAPWLQPISDTITGIAAMIQSYQQYHGLKRTGKKDSTTISYLTLPVSHFIDQIRINMERLRWLPQETEPLHVTVNIPSMKLFLEKDNEVVMEMNVVVGKTSRQTPVLNARMANVVINPPWGVPPTILKKDVLPGFAKNGNAYLRKKGLKVYDRNGNTVDPDNVTIANYKRYVFRQPPGDRNALGYIKFNLPNKWDIYLHDTPHRNDFTKYDRAQSSGCIRVQQPKEMARYILAELEGRRYTIERLDSVIRTHITRWEILKNKIPVHIIYLTASETVNGHSFCFARDIYQRDARLTAAIDGWN